MRMLLFVLLVLLLILVLGGWQRTRNKWEIPDAKLDVADERRNSEMAVDALALVDGDGSRKGYGGRWVPNNKRVDEGERRAMDPICRVEFALCKYESWRPAAA